MSRSLRAETRSRNSDIKRGTVRTDLKVRKWEKKWVTIGDTTMKIFKWVPISNSEKKKNLTSSKSDKENVQKETSQLSSNFGTEDSNTCFSMVSDSQGATDFVSSMPFSEDSNSQGSEGPKNV